MENKIAYLNMIQAIITRMGSNSFLLKGWSVTLVAALFALASENSNPTLVLIAYLPALVFWGLDGFFLWQEMLFRRLYDTARVLPEANIDFSMSTAGMANPPGWLGRTFSKTLVPFHGAIMATIIVVTLILYRH